MGVVKTITIDPVTRVEGHGKVSIFINDQSQVESAQFHVQEFRGFEKFCEGRMVWEMPVITPRICGICPVSHHLAAVKACDDLLKTELPPVALMLRELMHMGQTIHSHALHFFYLAAPDFLFGIGAAPEQRNVVGIAQTNPDLAKQAIRLRQIGQNLVERVGGRAIHPVAAIPGGMSKALTHKERFESLNDIREALSLARMAVELSRQLLEQNAGLVAEFPDIETMYIGLVKNGAVELYDGEVRLHDADGKPVTSFAPALYLDHIAEHVETFSYTKFPYYRELGWPDGIYRTGPLGRLNVADRMATPLAHEAFKSFKALGYGKPVHGSLYTHYARMIEVLYAVERAQELLEDNQIISQDVRTQVWRQAGEGVGVIEAPRGLLIHHYWADDSGKLEKANIIVATAHNNGAINKLVTQVAAKYLSGTGEPKEEFLNMIEVAIRCYDPCLSCSTHQVGKMPLWVEIRDQKGELVQELRRDA